MKIQQKLSSQLSHLFKPAVRQMTLSLCGDALQFGILTLVLGFAGLHFGIALASLGTSLALQGALALPLHPDLFPAR